jgi:hypothetical protein
MVMTIGPRFGGPVRTGRFSPKYMTLLPFALGSASGGAFVFGIAAWSGSLLLDAPEHTAQFGLAAIIVAAAFAYGASYVIQRPLALPTSRRQVPKLWREFFSPATAALLYGVGLGIGLFTRVPYVTHYVALALTVLYGDVVIGVCAGLLYGLGRWLPLAYYRSRQVQSGFEEEVDRVLVALRPSLATANGIALLALSTELVIRLG